MKPTNQEALERVKLLRGRLILARETDGLDVSDVAMLNRTIAELKSEHRRLLGVGPDTRYSAVKSRLKTSTTDLKKITEERKKLANNLVGATKLLNAATRVLALLGFPKQ